MKHLLVAITVSCLMLTARATWAADDPNEAMHVLDEGRVYRVVNGEAILGRDVLDLILEEQWDAQIQIFVEHILRSDEIAAAKISVTDEEVNAELQHMLESQARENGLDPKDMKAEDIVKRCGVPGGVAALKRSMREYVGLLRVLQKDKVLPLEIRVADKAFQFAMRERMDKAAGRKGLVFESKRLGQGEAVRIGARGFSRDEVRAYILDTIRSVSTSELKQHLNILSIDRVAQKAIKDKNLELTQDAREFHFSYLCRLNERKTGAPGREVMREQLKDIGQTPEQFLRSRLFSYDATITLLAKQPIREKDLKEEFAAHPESYKRNENLIAHILVRVLDPEGHVYTGNWKAPGHDAVNNYVAKMREQQFTEAKPKIEALLELARLDFEGTAKKFSEDSVSARVGGLVGRMGEKTIIFPPCDINVREAAIKLKPGEVSPPVRSDFGWHLLKCLEKQDVVFEEVAESAFLNLIHEARLKINADLQASMKIEDKF